MTRAAFNKKSLFTTKLDFSLSKKPVKCFISITDLCGAGSLTLGKVDQKLL
jgi:hypothetical protein